MLQEEKVGRWPMNARPTASMRVSKKSACFLTGLLLLFVVVSAGFYRYLPNGAGTVSLPLRALADSLNLGPEQSSARAPVPKPPPKSLFSDSMDLETLLENAVYSGAHDALAELQRRFPDDLRVIQLSVATATDPDSRWLCELEELQPDNFAPNLLRAGLLMKNGNVLGYLAELEKADGKSTFDIGAGERQREAIDRLLNDLASAREINPGNYIPTVDQSWMRTMDLVVSEIAKRKRVTGVGENAAEVALSLSDKLQGITDFGARLSQFGLLLENAALKTMPKGALLSDSGGSVADRQNQLAPVFEANFKRMEMLTKVMNGYDRPLKIQYLIRARADGEAQALLWLEKHMANNVSSP